METENNYTLHNETSSKGLLLVQYVCNTQNFYNFNLHNNLIFVSILGYYVIFSCNGLILFRTNFEYVQTSISAWILSARICLFMEEAWFASS